MAKRFLNIASVLALVLNLLILLGWFLVGDDYEFASPHFLYGLFLIPLLSFYYLYREHNLHAEVSLSTLSQFHSAPAGLLLYMRHLPFLLRMGGLALLIFSLARPQSNKSWQNRTTEGIDIVIALDISASMLAKDFDPNRLESSKEVAINFIKNRPNDRIGLVVYEGEGFTQSPLTIDHRVLINLFKDVHTGMVEPGTAVGVGLATAVNRLRYSDAKSKVVILLTDGENNKGSVSPQTAAEIASEFGVRVYTIGVGSKGKALSPTGIFPDGRYKYEFVDVNIDEETLKYIASTTGGEYFRATDENSLEDIYKEIDQLEKTRINVTEHRQKSEEYFWFCIAGAVLILVEFLLRSTIIRTVP